MIKRYIFSPLFLLALYFFAILVYAFIYSSSSSGLNKDLSFIEGIYFSVVTITTLGYGDILPSNKVFMMIIGSQSLLGIFILGLFISSTWQNYTKRIKDEKNKEYISSYFEVITAIENNYINSIKEVTKIKYLGEKIKFSNLKEIYHPSSFDFSRTRISVFYSRENEFLSELQIIRLNLDLELYPVLSNLISSYFKIHYRLDVKDKLLGNEKMQFGDISMTKMIYQEVEKHDVLPEKPGLIADIVNLYNCLDWKAECVKRMKQELDTIRKK